MLYKSKLAECFDNRLLNLIILPTEKCNFRCVYCYEDFKVGKMSLDVSNSIKNLLRARLPELKKVSISWFGGEPLLAYDIVVEIENFICNEIKDKNLNIAHGSSMTTNGYLLSIEKFETLLKLGINEYQITLDGIKAHHDKTRVLSNGKGSFEDILNNLIEIKKLSVDYRITIRLHYSKDCINEFEQLLIYLSDIFDSDKRFVFHIRSIEHLGSKNDKNIELLSINDRKIFEDKLMENFKNKLNFDEEKGDYICYAAKPNSLLIRANGQLAKCTVALYDDNNNIGKLNSDGTLNIFNSKLQKWFTGFETNDLETLACPLSKMN